MSGTKTVTNETNARQRWSYKGRSEVI